MDTLNQDFEIERGPSWQRSNWPLSDADDVNAALDPTQMAIEIKAAAKATGTPLPEADIAIAAGDSIRAMLLIRTYRVWGIWRQSLIPWGSRNRTFRLT